MGYTRHHAIIVSASYGTYLADARHKLLDIIESKRSQIAEDLSKVDVWLGAVTPIVRSPLNNHETFALAPDGSNEGWDSSDLGDSIRNEFVAYLRSLAYEDGSSPVKFVEVSYGEDDNMMPLIESFDGRRRNRRDSVMSTTDAQVWASTWCEVALENVQNDDDILDEEWMTTWFANAIEAGRVAGQRELWVQTLTEDGLSVWKRLDDVDDESDRITFRRGTVQTVMEEIDIQTRAQQRVSAELEALRRVVVLLASSTDMRLLHALRNASEEELDAYNKAVS